MRKHVVFAVIIVLVTICMSLGFKKFTAQTKMKFGFFSSRLISVKRRRLAAAEHLLHLVLRLLDIPGNVSTATSDLLATSLRVKWCVWRRKRNT